jgi:hypothetical protein
MLTKPVFAYLIHFLILSENNSRGKARGIAIVVSRSWVLLMEFTKTSFSVIVPEARSDSNLASGKAITPQSSK